VIRFSIFCLVGLACLHALLFGCSKELPPRTAIELMNDREVLEAVLVRCNSLGSEATRDRECRNAREAADRLAEQEAEEQKATIAPATQAEFERARAERRAKDERERRRREAEQHVDPYNMPLVKDPEPAANATAQDSGAPSPPQ
jgi:hypothetical protein